MDENDRRVTESPMYQGVDEQIAYTLTTTPWGSSPSNPAVVVKNSAGADVTASVTAGSGSVSGDVITTPIIKSLTAGEWYRVEVKFTISGNIPEAWFYLVGQT